MNNINNQLTSLYAKNWPVFSQKLYELVISDNSIKPTNPLLLFVKDEDDYWNADIRVMIFGQETNDWGDDFNGDISNIVSIYEEFFSTGRCFRYGGQFWNGISRFISMLKSSVGDKKVSFLWNNLIKTGKSGMKGRPPAYIYQVEKDSFNVIKAEIEILKPHLIIFLTGPNYDGIINNRLSIVKYKKIDGFNERQLAGIEMDSVKCALRTYHPNYLWRHGINTYYEAMIDHINKTIL